MAFDVPFEVGFLFAFIFTAPRAVFRNDDIWPNSFCLDGAILWCVVTGYRDFKAGIVGERDQSLNRTFAKGFLTDD